jgi:hypothetical protein
LTLKVLVIGKGEEAPRAVSNGHTLEFVYHAGLAPDFRSLQQYSFVFMHLGPLNPEARHAIESWSAKGWREKVIGFSGGDIPAWCAALHITTAQRLPNRNSILELHWGAVRPDFAGPAAELLSLLSETRCETLVALAVLCQGYLAVHAVHAGPEGRGGEPEEVRVALSQMGWDALGGKIERGELESWAAPSSVRDLMAEVSAPAWWLKVWEPGGGADTHLQKWEALVARLETECARGDTPQEIRTLLDAIRPDDDKDSRAQAVAPDIVSRAYTAITDILSK